MAIVKAVVSLDHVSRLPKDRVQNTFIFEDPGASSADAAAANLADLIAFYNTSSPGATHPVANWIDSKITRVTDGVTVEWTDITAHLDGSTAGPPFQVDRFTLAAAGFTGGLPAECAVVITLFGSGRPGAAVRGSSSSIPSDDRAQDEGAPATHTGFTHPKQSHTGRLYIGPLTADSAAYVDGEVRVADGCVTDLALAAGQLRSVGTVWSVWSRKLASVDGINDGVVDNAFDTQRRRGVASSRRVTI